jgi:hypothetical protein
MVGRAGGPGSERRPAGRPAVTRPCHSQATLMLAAGQPVGQPASRSQVRQEGAAAAVRLRRAGADGLLLRRPRGAERQRRFVSGRRRRRRSARFAKRAAGRLTFASLVWPTSSSSPAANKLSRRCNENERRRPAPQDVSVRPSVRLAAGVRVSLRPGKPRALGCRVGAQPQARPSPSPPLKRLSCRREASHTPEQQRQQQHNKGRPASRCERQMTRPSVCL